MKLISSSFASGGCFGLCLSLILAAGVHAGPGPQYSNQAQVRREQTAASAPAAASAVAPAMACPLCRVRVVGEFSATNPSGKWAPHVVAVGVERDCINCRGAITTVRGRATNGMANDCAICAQPRPSCCATSG